MERQCKKRKIGETYSEIFTEEDSDTINDDLLVEEVNLNIPTVQNKAEDNELNFAKQYKRLVDSCERSMYNIHEKEPGCKNKDIKGSSVDKRQIYIDFNAGMFEAIKKNFVRILKEYFETQIISNPKVETYGQSKAEERILLDLTMTVNKKQYDLKVKIYNTQCSLDVVARGNSPQKKFKALGDFTGGEYFARVIVPKLVQLLASKLDIKAINELCRLQATLGLKNSTSSVCIGCEKETKDKNFFKCNKCPRRHVL